MTRFEKVLVVLGVGGMFVIALASVATFCYLAIESERHPAPLLEACPAPKPVRVP